MKLFFSVMLSGCVLLMSSLASAASSVGQHYIERIANGGPSTVRDTARTIQKTKFSETEVLDVLAERLIQDYQQTSRLDVDAMSWAAIALGDSGNSRYYDVLTQVANTASNAKLAKHTKKSLKKLSNGNAQQYKAGSVSLTTLRAKNMEPAAQKTLTAKKSKNGYIALSEVQVGMSQAEINDLVGPPTATTNHITGRAFQPFNFKGNDTMRMYYLYKGQGRIVFSNESAYNNTWRVREVVINANETGYP